jgi:hypothetical protein
LKEPPIEHQRWLLFTLSHLPPAVCRLTLSGTCQSHFGHLVDVARLSRQALIVDQPHFSQSILTLEPKMHTIQCARRSLRLLFAWWREQMKFLALAAVLALLVAGSAVFVTGHPRAMTACVTDCD